MMINVNKIEDIYPAIDGLIKVLAQKNEQGISDVLHHRMYKVSWTFRSELFEELQGVLKDFLLGALWPGAGYCFLSQVTHTRLSSRPFFIDINLHYVDPLSFLVFRGYFGKGKSSECCCVSPLIFPLPF
jgi:hypothetical protein